MSNIFLRHKKKVIGFTILILLGLLLHTSYFQNIFIFPGSYMPVPKNDVVKTRTIRGQRVAYLLSGETSFSQKKQIALFFHGNGYNINQGRGVFENWSSVLNMPVLAIDYPGYGNSQGRIRRDKDLWCCVESFVKEYKAKSYEVFLIGESIGSAVAVEIASNSAYNIDGLILLGAFTTLPGVVVHCLGGFLGGFLNFFLRYDFDNLKKIKNVTCPTLIFHGENDNLLPVEYGKKLAQASGSNAYFMMIPGSGHIIRPSSSIGYNIRQHITDFLS